jgi:hypothetical protein
VVHARNECALSSVEKVLLDGIAHRAFDPETSENAIEFGEALHEARAVSWSLARTADERRDGGRNSSYGASSVWDFFHVRTRLGEAAPAYVRCRRTGLHRRHFATV